MRLRVGTLPGLLDLPPNTGVGRVWSSALPRLASIVDLVEDDPRPDVWLLDGHAGDPGVEGPVVVSLFEVNWGRPELDREHDPDFVTSIGSATEAAVRRADRIVTCATTSKGQIVDAYGFPPDRVHVVPFGVDRAIFHPDRSGTGATLVRNRLGDSRPYVLFAASLHPRKNLAAVRDAVVGLARRGFPHALALVAAPAPDRADSSDLAKEGFADLPGFPGRVVVFDDPTDSELSALMSDADAVCQPSTSEGFGLTVLEAMAAGAAVVVSDRGSLPELVQRGGLVVEPRAAAVEQALVRLLTRPRASRRLRSRAVRRAKKLSWERTAREWARVAGLAAGEYGAGRVPVSGARR
jgi:glycosyltransferase involved in cell wall biosynthesis